MKISDRAEEILETLWVHGEEEKQEKENIDKVISSFDKLEVHRKGKVAYIHTKEHKQLQKLMAMGVLPGMMITLIQKFPSYVFQIGQSQFAVDQELAGSIFVRITNS